MKISNPLLIFTLLFSFFVVGCKSTQPTTQTIPSINDNSRTYSIQSVLWQQNAAEYKALCYQAYQLAKMRLDKHQESKNDYDKPLAIITDIDETVLDNSPYNAKLIIDNAEYTRASWIEWGSKKEALAVPGALDFFKYADQNEVTIFYISNRFEEQKTETISNLKNLGFPQVKAEQVLLRTSTSGKQERREKVLKEYEVIMYLGDNLSDFSTLFENKSTLDRNKVTEELKAAFGDKFIVFPNPMYGDWESKGIYQGKYNWDKSQKEGLWRENLRIYK